MFLSAIVPASLSSISVKGNNSLFDVVTVVVSIEPVKVITGVPTKKENTRFEPCTTVVSSIAKYPASLSLIYLARKPSPMTTDYICPRVEMCGKYFTNVMCGS